MTNNPAAEEHGDLEPSAAATNPAVEEHGDGPNIQHGYTNAPWRIGRATEAVSWGHTRNKDGFRHIGQMVSGCGSAPHQHLPRRLAAAILHQL